MTIQNGCYQRILKNGSEVVRLIGIRFREYFGHVLCNMDFPSWSSIVYAITPRYFSRGWKRREKAVVGNIDIRRNNLYGCVIQFNDVTATLNLILFFRLLTFRYTVSICLQVKMYWFCFAHKFTDRGKLPAPPLAFVKNVFFNLSPSYVFLL